MRLELTVNIAYLVPLRYPTEKAYGTNIANTSLALSKLGNVVTIWTTNFQGQDEKNNLIASINLSWIEKFKYAKAPLVKNFGFYLSQLIYSLRVSIIFRMRSAPDLVLTRSPLCAYFVRVRNAKTILELHHLPSKFEIFLLNKLQYKIQLIVTNSDFLQQIQNLGVQLVAHIIPNVAPEEFHSVGKLAHNFRIPLTIGYAGKTISSGNENGVKIAIDLLKEFPEIAEKLHLIFVGCEDNFYECIRSDIEAGNLSESQISFYSHIPQNQLTDIISKFDLALIPYPDKPYYERSFPIKIIEMASAGIPMLISNTKAHRRILGCPNDFFYEAESTKSLHAIIDRILKNLDSLVKERDRLLDLSKNSTYLWKAEQILKLALGVNLP